MTTKVKEVKKVMVKSNEQNELEKLQAKIEKMKLEQKKLKELEKVEAKEMAEKEKELKLKKKSEDATNRVLRIKEALELKGEEQKINMTLKIKEMAIKEMTIDMMVEETGWNRKSILDRVWLIEKSLGLR